MIQDPRLHGCKCPGRALERVSGGSRVCRPGRGPRPTSTFGLARTSGARHPAPPGAHPRCLLCSEVSLLAGPGPDAPKDTGEDEWRGGATPAPGRRVPAGRGPASAPGTGRTSCEAQGRGAPGRILPPAWTARIGRADPAASRPLLLPSSAPKSSPARRRRAPWELGRSWTDDDGRGGADRDDDRTETDRVGRHGRSRGHHPSTPPAAGQPGTGTRAPAPERPATHHRDTGG